MSTLKVNTIDSHSGSTLTIDSTADVSVASTTSASSNTTGALKVVGGISTQENLYVGGNAVITGTMTANGGTITLGDADTDNVSFGGEVNSDVLPNTSNTFDLGSATKKWAEIHATTFTGALTGNSTTATALETARNIGGVSFDGSANINLPGVNTSGTQDTTGNAATATALETSRTIGLSGDVSGSASFDGTGNATITATVADDSHNHTTANVDGLDTALGLKAPLASPALTGTPTAPTAAANTNTTQVATTAYVQTELTDLLDGAPAALDTLNEIAASINDDADYAGTITSSLSTKVDKVAGKALSENDLTDALKSKLDGIEASADVTDTTNVTAAGALMDSEVTNLADVKAFDTTDYATATQGTTADNALPKAGGAMTGAITTNSTFDGRDVATDGAKLDGIEAGATADQTDEEIQDIVGGMVTGNTESGITVTYQDVDGTLDFSVASQTDENFTTADHSKLDGIEASADVTDTTNVTAAGALMDSEVTNLAQVKAFDSSDYATSAQGTTADNALPKSGGAMTGAITTNSTFDGRDVATDGAKLDGIESGATADQSASEIRTLVSSASDSNVFTDTLKSKLDGIESGATADQTSEEIQDIAGAMWTGNSESGVSVTYQDADGTMDINVNDPTITLSGDVSGSAIMTNLGNVTISATVANDSHDHTDKAPLASPALTGTPTAPTAASNTNNTQVATTAYVQTEITDLIGGAPGALNTLNELAAAIDDDSSYASTVTSALGGKVGTSSAQALSSDANAMTISDHTITLARADGTTDTVTVPDNNTTYSVGDGGLTQKNFTTTLKNKLDGIAASANNYSHPTYNGDDFSIDTGHLSGATVIDDIDINVTTDSQGHVTDANGTVATRNLTLADLGYTGATNANYITNNNQLTNGAGYITGYTNTNQLTTFQLEDGDGTEVTVSHGKEVKFVEGSGMDINWTDTSTGSNADPFDMTFTNTDRGSSQNIFKNVASDSGTAVADNNNDTLTITGGSNCSTSVSGDTLTITATDTNTTYSAGTGLDLSSTTFSIESDLREGGTGSDRYWGNTHDYVFADASTGLRLYSAGSEGIRLDNSNNTQIYGTLVETSAAVYKENIIGLPDQLANVMKLRPVEYDRKTNGNHEIGLIADEVNEILPELVSTKDGEPEALNYSRMVSVLVKAVQELTEKVEKLSK